MRAVVIADTHMPRGNRAIPDECVDALRRADLIVHAGDFIRAEVLEWLEAIGPQVRAVHGNVDDAALRSRLPQREEFELAGSRIGLIHDAGPAKGRLGRMRRAFPDADAVVFGHSHLPLHEADGDFQIFNPGSPTERRRAPQRSFGVMEAGPGGLRFRHVWLP